MATYESEYLQNRLRERKAENARSSTNSKQSDPDSVPKRNNPGRDDAIFADEPSPPARRVSTRTFQSSPANAAQAMSQRVSSHTRRTSNSAGSPAGGGRLLGAREAEEQLDKLSKQNFDLKLEVYHRREKVGELEKKLEELPQLRDDNAELLEVNEDLLQELDKRDKAIDEAVMIICDLEEKVRMLQDPQGASEALSEQIDPRGIDIDPTQTPNEKQRSKRRRQDPNRLSVSPEVSAHMAEMSSTPRPKIRQAPSFLNTEQTGAHTLRSQYMDGNRQIRPIPSFGTLGAQSLEDEEVDLSDEMLRSPALSEISESEFKSLYGRDDQTDTPGDEQAMAAPPESPALDSSASERSRRARTNQWVNDGTVPAQRSPKPSSSRSSPRMSQYQSLSSVIHDSVPAEFAAVKKEREQRPRRTHGHEPGEYAQPFTADSVYGQNVFPPTPDTMLTRDTTRPSTHSSSSVIADKSKRELPVTPSSESPSLAFNEGELRAQRPTLSTSDSSLFRSGAALQATRSGNGLNPPPMGNHYQPPRSPTESYNSDEAETTPRSRQRPSHLHRNNTFDTEVSGQSANLTYQQRSASSRSRHGASVALEGRPVPRRRSISATPTQQSFFESRSPALQGQANSPSEDAHALTPQTARLPRLPGTDRPPSRTVHLAGGSRPATPRRAPPGTPTEQFVPPQPPSDAPPEPPKHATLPSRSDPNGGMARPTDTLRQRVSKFARRNSNSAPVNTRSDSSNSFHTPPSGPALSPTSSQGPTSSLSLRTRKFFHRRRSSASQKSPPNSPTQQRRKITQSNGEDDIAAGSRSSSFMDAAKAAMPHLDLVGNERKTPSTGISTGIPIMSTPQRQPDQGVGQDSSNKGQPQRESKSSAGLASTKVAQVSATRTPVKPAMGNGREASDLTEFPRRGRGGEATQQRTEPSRQR